MHPLLDCTYFFSLSWLNEYEDDLSTVASKDYLVWLVVWDNNHTFHKYNLVISLYDGPKMLIWLM